MILVAESETASRELLRRLLTRHGHNVAFAGTASEARHVLKANGPAIRVVLIDLALSGGDPLQFVSEARASCPTAEIVACCAEHSAARSLPAGVHLLRKPYQFDDVIELIGRGDA